MSGVIRERKKTILGLITSAVIFCVKINLGLALMSSMGNESMELTELCVTKENKTIQKIFSNVFFL